MHQTPAQPSILKLSLNNPITHAEIDLLILSIAGNQSFPHLLIDFGQHEFTLLSVLRYCKEELNRIVNKLELFERIAFVVPAQYQGLDQKQLRYFSVENLARDWLAHPDSRIME